MATTEHNALIRAKDASGNSLIICPVTKAENVVGLSEAIAEVAQSDYADNNPESKAYIKNRPCYREINTVVFLETPSAGTSGQTAANLGDTAYSFVPGETYTVQVNDETLSIVCNDEGKLVHSSGSIWTGGNTGSYTVYAWSWWEYGSYVKITGPVINIVKLDRGLYDAVNSLNGQTGDMILTIGDFAYSKNTPWIYRSNVRDSTHTLAGNREFSMLVGRLDCIDFPNPMINIADTITLTALNDNMVSFQSNKGSLAVHTTDPSVILTGLAAPKANQDAVNLEYLNDSLSAKSTVQLITWESGD